VLGIKNTKTPEISISMIKAIPRYRDLQGSTVTVLIRCPIFLGLLTGSFVNDGTSAKAYILLTGSQSIDANFLQYWPVPFVISTIGMDTIIP
jgi:hypothetical protein